MKPSIAALLIIVCAALSPAIAAVTPNTETLPPLQGGMFAPFEADYAANQVLLGLTPDAAVHLTAQPDGSVTLENLPQLWKVAQEFGVNRVEPLFPMHLNDRRAGTFQWPSAYQVFCARKINVLSLVHHLMVVDGVRYAEPNYRLHTAATIPDDPLYSTDQWNLQGDLNTANIRAPQAWDVTTGDPNIVIASLDTGVDYTHEDLSGKMWVNMGETPGNDLDDDNNGYVDDVYGYDVYDHDGDPMDTNGHGTSTSSVAAASSNNDIGITGVAWQCRLMAVRVGGTFAMFCSDVARGVQYASENGARVLTMSLGTVGSSKAMEEAFSTAAAGGIVACVANTNSRFLTPFYPAAYRDTLGIAATNQNDVRADFSSHGPHTILGAPGVDIPSAEWGGGYGHSGGTSLATPHSAGAAALVASLHPELSAPTIRQILQASADASVEKPGWDIETGYGRLDLNAAVHFQPPDITLFLREPRWYDFVNERFDLIGTVNGRELDSYDIQVGVGMAPSSWNNVSRGNVAIDDLLAQVDLSGFSGSDFTVRLRARSADGRTLEDRTFVRKWSDLPNHGGYPVMKDGSFRLKAAVVDLDGSGCREVVANAADGKVYVMDADGEDVGGGWPVSTEFGDTTVAGVTIGDFDGMAGKEVVIGAMDRKVYAWHHDGMPLAGWPVDVDAPVVATAPMDDLDGDGVKEIAVATLLGSVYVFEPDGSLRTGWPQSAPWAIVSSPAMGDLDGDGTLEVIVGSAESEEGRKGLVHAWHADGTKVTGFPFEAPSGEVVGLSYFSKGVSGSLALADFDHDGASEIVAPFNDSSLFLLDGDGSVIWEKPSTEFALYIFSSPALGDLDMDGNLEIAVGCSAFVYVVRGKDGGKFGRFPKVMSEPTFSSPSIADVDGDGKQDVLIGGGDGNVWAWDDTGKEIFHRQTGNMVIPAPTIADLDCDGKAEIIVGSNNGLLFAWDQNATYAPSGPGWGQFHHDLRNTGRYETDADSPAAPASLQWHNTANGVALTWTPSADADVAYYKVYYDTDDGYPFQGTGATQGASPYVADSNTTTLLSGLTEGNDYYVSVTAVDRSGNESWYSASVMVTPSSVVPPVVVVGGYLATNVTAAGGGNITLLLIATHPGGPSSLGDADLGYQGTSTGVMVPPNGDGSYTWTLPLPPGVVPGPLKLVLEARVAETSGAWSTRWPYLTVE